MFVLDLSDTSSQRVKVVVPGNSLWITNHYVSIMLKNLITIFNNINIM